jgi:hypothetical protein
MDNTAKLNTDAILSVRIMRTSCGWGEWEPINATSVDSTHIRATTIAKDSRNVTGVPSFFLMRVRETAPEYPICEEGEGVRFA